MPRLSFSLRDVFWLTLVVAMGCAWCVQVSIANKLSEANRQLINDGIAARATVDLFRNALKREDISWERGNGTITLTFDDKRPTSPAMENPFLD